MATLQWAVPNNKSSAWVQITDFKNEHRCQLSGTDMHMLCLCFFHLFLKEQKSHKNSKEVCDFQLTQACPLPDTTTIKILATMIYWGLLMGPQPFAPTWTLIGLLTEAPSYVFSIQLPGWALWRSLTKWILYHYALYFTHRIPLTHYTQ